MIIDTRVTYATGTAEVDAALEMLDQQPGKRRLTLGADRGYDQRRLVDGARQRRVTPHVAQNTRRRRLAIDGRTTRHVGYIQSIHARHRVETPFGWGKYGRPLRQTMLRGFDGMAAQAKLALASYNPVRIAAQEAA